MVVVFGGFEMFTFGAFDVDQELGWFYPDSPDTSLRVDNPHLEVKNAKKTIYSRI